jgi:hypothetical protein
MASNVARIALRVDKHTRTTSLRTNVAACGAHHMSTSSGLTRVTLVYMAGQTNIWLRFGHPLYERHLDSMRRQLDFRADALFGRVHWEGNDYGTTCWRLQVLRTVHAGAMASRIAGVEPGGEIILDVSCHNKVHRVLALIDAIEAQRIDPADVSPAYWRTAQNRLAVHQDPPLYDGRTHAAFLTWRSLQS